MSERVDFERFLTAATASTAGLLNQENKILGVYSRNAARLPIEGARASTLHVTHCLKCNLLLTPCLPGKFGPARKAANPLKSLVPQEGLEPPTP